MSHEIWELDRPAYGSNKPAWHNLGTVVPGTMTAEEALRLGRLDWNVELEPVYGDGAVKIPDAYVTARMDLALEDPRRFLGVVGNRYTPIQNSEAFRLGDAILDQAAGARWETVGSLRNGRTVWMLAKLPGDQSVRDDKIESYLLLRTAHDGSSSLEALLTPIRVVCWNTLSLALGGKKTNRVKVRHTKSARVNMSEARRILGLASDYTEEHANRMRKLADVPIDKRFADAFGSAMFPDKKDQNNTRARNARAEVSRLYNGRQAGAGQQAIDGTAYGLLNAFTEYLDHRTTPQTSKRSDRELAESRFESILYGGRSHQRQRAYDLISRATGVDGNGAGIVEQVLEERPAPTDSPDVDALLGALDLG